MEISTNNILIVVDNNFIGIKEDAIRSANIIIKIESISFLHIL